MDWLVMWMNRWKSASERLSRRWINRKKFANVVFAHKRENISYNKQMTTKQRRRRVGGGANIERFPRSSINSRLSTMCARPPLIGRLRLPGTRAGEQWKKNPPGPGFDCTRARVSRRSEIFSPLIDNGPWPGRDEINYHRGRSVVVTCHPPFAVPDTYPIHVQYSPLVHSVRFSLSYSHRTY